MQEVRLLNEVIQRNGTKRVQALVDQKMDLNGRIYGYTLIMVSCLSGNERLMKVLLKAGVDVKKKDNKNGRSPLHFSSEENIIQLLLDHGAEIHDLDDNGCTPLHRACEYAWPNTIKCLLKNGANLEDLDYDKRIPIMHVLGKPDHGYYQRTHPDPREVLPFLLKYCDVNVIDKQGYNILRVSREEERWLYLILMHVAKLKVLDRFIHQSLLDFISNDQKLNKLFTMYCQELLKAKSIKFTNSWVSFFNFVVDDKKKLMKYAINWNIVKDFNKCDVMSLFPVYGEKIRENFTKAIEKRKIWNSSVITLSNHLLIFDSNHLIIRNIIDCLTTKDLLVLR